MEVRKLESGDWVVDLGRKWFRVRKNGEIITKIAARRKGDLCGSIKTRNATAAERQIALNALATAERGGK